jgi:FtsH-binding integral membrane protein
MQLSTLSIIIFVTLTVLVFMVYRNVISQLTEKSYLATTYMYVFMALLLIVLINDQKFIQIESGMKYTALCFLILILTVALQFVSQENQIMKHLVWIALIGAIGLLLSPVINVAKSQNILNKVLITISVMFIVMTYFAYSQPLGYLNTWQPYLYAGLIGIIVTSLANIIFSDLGSSGFNTRTVVISGITALLFNGFLFYDMQQIIKDSQVLKNVCIDKDNLSCADYPTKSLSVILDVINLFTSTTNVYSHQ